MSPSPADSAEAGASAKTGTKKLVIGVVNDPPYLVKEKSGEWTGLNLDIWKAVAQDLKIDYELKEMRPSELIDELTKGRIDMSIDAFYITADKQRIIDYSFAFGNARLGVATLPEKIHHPWWEAIRIFFSWGTVKVIALLGSILCLLGLLLWWIEREANRDHFGGGALKGISSGIYWVGSTLASGVCFGVDLKSLPARILGLIWMLVCAVALSALIASLTTSLTASRSTIEAVNEDTLRRMYLGVIRAGAEESTLHNLGGRYKTYDEEEEALNALLAGTVEGFLYDEITLHYYKNNTYRGRISVYPTKFKRFFYGFAYTKGSPWRTTVDYGILRLKEKPDWAFILRRHGLEDNFEEIQAPFLKQRRTE